MELGSKPFFVTTISAFSEKHLDYFTSKVIQDHAFYQPFTFTFTGTMAFPSFWGSHSLLILGQSYHFCVGDYSNLIPELMANGLALMSVSCEGQQDQTCTITSTIYKTLVSSQ